MAACVDGERMVSAPSAVVAEIVVLLLLVVLGSVVAPARRALRISPLVALRE